MKRGRTQKVMGCAAIFAKLGILTSEELKKIEHGTMDKSSSKQ